MIYTILSPQCNIHLALSQHSVIHLALSQHNIIHSAQLTLSAQLALSAQCSCQCKQAAYAPIGQQPVQLPARFAARRERRGHFSQLWHRAELAGCETVELELLGGLVHARRCNLHKGLLSLDILLSTDRHWHLTVCCHSIVTLSHPSLLPIARPCWFTHSHTGSIGTACEPSSARCALTHRYPQQSAFEYVGMRW